jgi:Ni2+-binding GTPase involved in maturation of urease and hydrogenase
MVGGFLGAGKTTALLRLAERFRDQGLRVGLITNDQSVGLVDTTMLANHDFPVEEITGGCFCCKFNSLTDAAEKLSADERPDVFLAEPVGSCTDLVATVAYPLRRMYGEQFAIAPYSVLVDPVRAERILGLSNGKSFSTKVVYIYRKQLEEADVIVVNKVDTLDVERLRKLTTALHTEFPRAKIAVTSARDGTGIGEWAGMIDTCMAGGRPTMQVDYDIYADGEALLGWMNLTASVNAPGVFDGDGFLASFMTTLHQRLQTKGIEIAHLKATLSPYEGMDIAVMNLTRSDGSPESSHTLQDHLESGELIVNLRAEADPEVLKTAAVGVLEEQATAFGLEHDVEHIEAFRPGRPVPTHRDSDVRLPWGSGTGGEGV